MRAGTIEERMEAWKEEAGGADECVGAAGAESSTDALSVSAISTLVCV